MLQILLVFISNLKSAHQSSETVIWIHLNIKCFCPTANKGCGNLFILLADQSEMHFD